MAFGHHLGFGEIDGHDWVKHLFAKIKLCRGKAIYTFDISN